MSTKTLLRCALAHSHSRAPTNSEKTYPALFGLLKYDYLPHHTHIVGYARSDLKLDEFRKRVTDYVKLPASAEKERHLLQQFKHSLEYVNGQYDQPEGFQELAAHLAEHEKRMVAEATKNGVAVARVRRLFYLALPPTAFYPVAKHIHQYLYQSSASANTECAVIVEKPFGRDLQTSNELSAQLGSLFDERELYRIDHYLGKEMVKNLLVLRFGNLFFGHIWNRNYISNVQITFKEPFGTEGRGGYFDQNGIIRDVLQNHLVQVLSLVAMERPVSLGAEDVRDEKVKVLKCIQPITNLSDVVLGQYTRSPDGKQPGYLDDPTVPAGSTTPTYCAMALFVQNERWADVPFILKAGKALNEKKAEIRIQFRDVPGALFPGLSRNELVIRVQPDEAVYMKFMNKRPGLGMDTTISELDLTYKHRYNDAVLPEAYESLILDALNGDRSNFVRVDELREAWRIFTPMLHQVDAGQSKPVPYMYGSRGPDEVNAWLAKLGYLRDQGEYRWAPSPNKL